MKLSSTLALALAASLAAGPAVAQDNSSDAMGANGLPAECAELGPALDQETINRIEDLNERRQALSCMVGTPRDYSAELSARGDASKPKAVNVEEAFGTDAVARGLAESADAQQAAGDESMSLSASIEADERIRTYLEQSGYSPIEVIGYAITPSATYLYLAPEWSTGDNMATGSISADEDEMDNATDSETQSN